VPPLGGRSDGGFRRPAGNAHLAGQCEECRCPSRAGADWEPYHGQWKKNRGVGIANKRAAPSMSGCDCSAAPACKIPQLNSAASQGRFPLRGKGIGQGEFVREPAGRHPSRGPGALKRPRGASCSAKRDQAARRGPSRKIEGMKHLFEAVDAPAVCLLNSRQRVQIVESERYGKVRAHDLQVSTVNDVKVVVESRGVARFR